MPTIPLEQQLAAALRKHVVFSLLEGEALAQLARELEMVSFALGETIVKEGEAGDCAYLIFAGKVRVFKEGPAGKPITLATLGAGDLFGENAILRDEARTASVRACEDCVLFRIPRAAFAQLLRDQPSLSPYLERLQRQRAVHRFLQMGTLLGAVPGRQVWALLDQFEECHFPSGHVVCREGEPGDRMYIIHAGEAKVMKGGPGQETILLYLGPSDYFGERALILDEPRYASVVALSDLACFSLRRESFAQLEGSAPQLQEQLTRRLEQYPLAEEMARKFGARPPAPTEAAEVVVEEKLEGPPESHPAAYAARLASRRNWLGFPRPFPFHPQEDETDCGAASLAMIASYHNVPLSVDRLRDLAHVGPAGASLLSLTKAAEAIGFSWRAVTTDDGHLDGLTLPAIAHWKGFHYLVLYACAGDKVVLGDPARGLVKMSRREFAAGWTGGLLLLTPTPDLGRLASTRTGWQCLWGLLAPFHNALGGMLLLSAFLSVIQVAFPLLTQHLVDRVLGRGETGLPFTLSAGLLVAGISMGAALLLRQHLIERLLVRISANLNTEWFVRLLMLPWRYFQSRPVGRLLAHLESIRALRGELATLTLATLLDFMLLVVGLGVLLSYNPMLALIMLGSLILSAGLPLFGVFRDPSHRPGSGFQEASIRSAWVEAIQAQGAIKDASAEAELCRRHRALLANPADTLGRSYAFQMVSWTAAIHAVAGVGALWYGAYLVLERQLTVGQLVAVQSLVGLMAIPVLGLAGLWPTVVEFRRFLRVVAENEALPPEQDPGQQCVVLPRLRGLICLDGVAYRPHPESRDLLSHINLELRPGQIVWLVGRSGAGKTTLALLLQRLLEPSEGKITVDGVDLATVDLPSLRSQVSVISEEPALVRGTIRENIGMADPGAALEKVIEAAKLACAHDFIMRLPLAYDTMLGPGGVQLSRGQKQTLCIARGLLKDPRLLILDDATSALDAETERTVLKNMRWLADDRATIVLSRRPLAGHPNDLTVVLEDGQIVDQGTHSQLLNQPGLYAYLTADRPSPSTR